jgi:hypothetical protein
VLGDPVPTTDGKWITRMADQPHGEKRITYGRIANKIVGQA